MDMLTAEYPINERASTSDRQVGEALERVLRSGTFRRASRLKGLLAYVVNAAVGGRSTDERRIASELFGKAGDFSPTLDPIIRVQLGRLRKNLARYYNSEGHQDPIVIEIPKRSYTPMFRHRSGEHMEKPSPVLMMAGSSPDGGQPEGGESLEQAVASESGIQSIAVLPFANLTNDPKQDAFCYGLTEEITTALAAVPCLNVVASSSAFQFRNEHFDVREVGRELGVPLILEGSVRMERGQTRVTAQLARSEDGVAIWSDSFDAKVNGSLNTQRAMARRVLGRLPLGT
jgi:adenylate cyclase